jgi:hypothetical protein
MSKQFSSAVNLVIVTVLAAAFSLITLWLIDSWIKYPLFLFEIFTIMVLYFIIGGYEIRVETKCNSRLRFNWGLLVDTALISSSAALLALASPSVDGGLIRTILALVCTSLIPGYALLNVFGLISYFTRLEGILLSYILSYVYTALLVLVLLPINGNLRGIIILLSYIALGVLSVLKHWRHPSTFVKGSFAGRIDILALLLSVAFYVLSFCFIYPSLALRPGSDISRHYASSIVLWRTPELYSAYQYFLAHLHEAAFVNLSNAPVTAVQTALVSLNLMMPLAFYAMAKSYMESIDKRLPAISTIFYSAFSGFAWVYLARLKLDGVQGSIPTLLSMVNDRAYNGAMYTAQPFLWYVPLSLSFTIFMVQLMLLKKMDMLERYFMVTFFLLLIGSYMAHITEAVIFSLFLSFYAFFSKGRSLRVDDALKASIMGFAFLSIFYTILQYVFAVKISFSLTITLFLPMAILAFTYVFRRLAVRDKLIQSLSKLAVKRLITTIFYVASFVYVLGLLVWVAGVPSFSTRLVVDVGLIPWFIYPVFLGVVGLLMLVALYYLIQDYEKRALLMPFIALIIFSFVFGRSLTYVNIYFFDAGYWEKRFTAYLYLASAVIAPLTLHRFFAKSRLNYGGLKKTLLSTVTICLIVIYGFQSMFIVLEYYTVTSYSPSEEELNAVDILADILKHDKYAYTITLTGYSYDVLTFSAPPYKLTGMQIVYTAENPEMTLLSMKAHNLSHAYLYMHKRDYDVLNRYSGSYLARHLTPMLPTVYRNSEVTIYNVSSVSFPQSNSTTALVVPLDSSLDPAKRWLYAYDILSLGEYNYTALYDLDKNVFSYDTLILSFDPPQGNMVKDSFYDDFAQKRGWREVSGTWQYTSGGLAAGKKGEYQDAIILSPIGGRNFTASLSFKPLDGDLKVANYVSIVYDWRDKQNFKYAGLMFDGSGVVYAYFSSCDDGKITVYPPWPGLKTSLRWRFGDLFNLTLSAQGDTLSLFVNGTQYLSKVEGRSGGGLGIRMTRFYEVLFSSFKAEASRLVQLRGGDEYLEYVKNGGRLIVLNTNGYGYFAGRALAHYGGEVEANAINGSRSIDLPLKVSAPNLHPTKEDVKIICYYTSLQGSSVYAFKENVGSGEIVYVNLHPILQALENSKEKSAYYGLLGKLLEPTGVQLERFKYTPPPITATFREVEMSGRVEISTVSLLFPINVDFKRVEVIDRDGRVTLLTDVTGLQLSNYNYVSLATSNLTLSAGKGFYSNLKFGGNVTMAFDSDLTTATLTSKDGKTLKLDHVKTITVNSDKASLYAREPTITLQGTAYFKELYSSGTVLSKTRAYGQNLRVEGAVTLKTYLSDTYTYVCSFDISGKFERVPPILTYDELTSLPQAAFWSIVLAPAFIALALILHREEKGKLRYG